MFKPIMAGSLLIVAAMMFLTVTLVISLDAVPHPQEINRRWVNNRADGFSNATAAKSNPLISELNPNNGLGEQEALLLRAREAFNEAVVFHVPQKEKLLDYRLIHKDCQQRSVKCSAAVNG
jgi:hypothetical protein